MAFNGSGTYVLPGAALATGAVISSSEHNTFRSDVATALTTCITRDGQSPATANIPMGGNKLTGLAAATVAGDAVRYEQIPTASSLGLVIGTNVQAYSANLDEYAAVNPTAAGLALLDDADAAAQRVTLQAQQLDDQLSSLIRQNSNSAAYTLVLTDSGKHILHPSADTTARTFTIPANASVAYTIGTALTFINQNGAGVITISITSDTMRLAGAGTTGSRTLAANGLATAIKITSTEWIISGSGLS